MTTKVHELILKDATNRMLEVHLSEIAEECGRIVDYCHRLRQSTLSAEERDTYEGKLYAALSHLQNHIGPALQEWDRVIEALPQQDD